MNNVFAQHQLIQGKKLPRLTTVQRDQIDVINNNNAKGQLIFNMDNNCIEYWNGKKWISICADIGGCMEIKDMTILPNSTVTKAFDCNGDAKQGNDGTVGFKATAAEAEYYEWYVDGVKQNVTTDTFTYILPNIAGTHSIYAVAINPCDTVASASVTVNITRDTIPVVSITSSETIALFGSNLNMTGTPSGGLWTSSAESVATIDSSTGLLVTQSLGVTYITYSYTDSNGCTDYETRPIVVQPNVLEITDDGTPPTDVITYVGAFWRAGETGERIIRIKNMYGSNAANRGPWQASVAWYDSKWNTSDGDGIVLSSDMVDEISLAERGISYSTLIQDIMISDAENHQVTGGPYAVGIVDENHQDIIFRIGLKSPLMDYHEIDNPARYAVVLLSYGTPAKIQKIFIRQGEGADIIFGGITRWSPYNMNDNKNFVEYPTQAGHFYQYGYQQGTTTPRPYPPVGTTLYPSWLNDEQGSYSLANACKDGYRTPVHSEMNTILQANGNSFSGYYADGFFDRRQIVASQTGVANSAVSATGNNVAYIGRLFFNPTNNVTLFFPAAGYRTGSSGTLSTAGNDGCYVANSSSLSNRCDFLNFWGSGALISMWPRSNGYSLRPVR